MSAANALLKAAFAPDCAACGSPLEWPLDGCVCLRCWRLIEPAPHVEWPAGPLAAVAAAGNYQGALRQIVHALKYDGRRSLARPIGGLMRAHGCQVLEGAHYVVPVPLHPWRRVRRGFNQAADLGSTLGIPMRRLLWRVRATAPQADLTAAERRRNVAGAFALSPFVSARDRRAIRGAIVVLVDDVRTTGATLHACAEVLAGAGAAEVRAITAAVRADDKGVEHHPSGATTRRR
jgi:ComF family protein